MSYLTVCVKKKLLVQYFLYPYVPFFSILFEGQEMTESPQPHSPPTTNASDQPGVPTAGTIHPTLPQTAPTSTSSLLNPFDPRCPLTSDANPDYLNAPQTWAERNPNAIQQPEPRTRAKPTAAAKAARKITTAANKEAAILLSTEIDKLRAWQTIELQKIATAHSKKLSVVEKMFNNRTHFVKPREVNKANALTHRKAQKMNEGTYLFFQL